MKNNLSKEDALQEYLSKRRKKDDRNSFIHSIIQVITGNLAVIVLICCMFNSSEFDFVFLCMTILCGLFALGLDWAFYDTYIKKDVSTKRNKQSDNINKDINVIADVQIKEKVFCTNCGKEIEGAWKYCKFCGQENK